MKREVERELRLQAFELERGDLELLWSRLRSLFDTSQAIRASISLTLINETLTFDSVEELNGYTPLRGRVTRFSISMSQDGQSVEVRSGGLFSSVPTVKVSGKSDVWCAGALEAVMHVMKLRRVWYYWLARFPFFTALLVLGSIQWFEVGPFSGPTKPSAGLALTWVSITLFLAFFAAFRERLLPMASISFSRELGFLRRYASEIGLILGVAAIALSVYMWVKPYGA